jgi:benzylsuccinate CoA-transferase BbsF subunit
MLFKRERIEAGENTEKQALAGVKVLDFGAAMAGSLVGRYLGEQGAQVVLVESIMAPQAARAVRQASVSTATNPDNKPMFSYLHGSKYSMLLNLKHPRAGEVVDRLVRWADVVNENLVPGKMSRLGFGYEYMRKIKPDIIMVSGSLYGQTGPLAREAGWDDTGAAASGRSYLTGWVDREPITPGTVPYGDYTLPLFGVLAIVAALDYKRRTGKGQYIEGSMFEVCAHQVAPALLDWEANEHLQTRTGNRVSCAAPHGVFPCVGDDRWCAIAVFTDEEWKVFCHVIGDPPWTKEQRFATLNSRKENEDELEKLVAEWTKKHSAGEVMQMMQAAGVAAGVVQNARDLLERDPQLKERQFLVPLKHPVLGVFGHPTPPCKLSKIKTRVRRSPCLGEHTEYVCTQLLNMSDEEFVELLQERVFE